MEGFRVAPFLWLAHPQAFDEELKRRGLEGMSAELLALDETRRAQMTALQNGLARRKDLSALFGKAKSQGTELSSAELAELQSLKNNIPQGEAEVERLERELNAMLAAIPNLPAADVPEGADEHANVEVSRWGTPRSFEFSPQDHADFGPSFAEWSERSEKPA